MFTEGHICFNPDNKLIKQLDGKAYELMQNLEFRNLYERFAAVMGDNKDADFGLFGEVVGQPQKDIEIKELEILEKI